MAMGPMKVVSSQSRRLMPSMPTLNFTPMDGIQFQDSGPLDRVAGPVVAEPEDRAHQEADDHHQEGTDFEDPALVLGHKKQDQRPQEGQEGRHQHQCRVCGEHGDSNQ